MPTLQDPNARLDQHLFVALHELHLGVQHEEALVRYCDDVTEEDNVVDEVVEGVAGM